MCLSTLLQCISLRFTFLPSYQVSAHLVSSCWEFATGGWEDTLDFSLLPTPPPIFNLHCNATTSIVIGWSFTPLLQNAAMWNQCTASKSVNCVVQSVYSSVVFMVVKCVEIIERPSSCVHGRLVGVKIHCVQRWNHWETSDRLVFMVGWVGRHALLPSAAASTIFKLLLSFITSPLLKSLSSFFRNVPFSSSFLILLKLCEILEVSETEELWERFPKSCCYCQLCSQAMISFSLPLLRNSCIV